MSTTHPTAATLRAKEAQEIFRRYRVAIAYLFGSRARGEAGPESDVDVAILLPPEGRAMERLDRASALASELKRLLGLPVEVVVLNDADPLLRFEAVVRGVAVRAPALEDLYRFEQQVRRRFEDFRHIQGIFSTEHRRRLGFAA